VSLAANRGRAILVLALAALLAGCSGVRFAYDNADTFIRWRALQFLDVHDEASDELDERIAAFLRWHRAQELPQYAREADEAARRVARGLSREDVLWGYDAFVARAEASLRMAVEQAAPMLDRLDAGQLQHMQERLAEENRKFAREYLRGAERERRERRTRRVVERLEDWVGTLSKAQTERVRQYSERMPLIDEMRDQDNKRLQTEVLAIVRAHEAQKRLAERLADRERGRDPLYVKARAESWSEFHALIIDIDRLASAEQRARTVSELRRYAEEFRALAARPTP
jgi:hypothetical protein